jgi:hypothetical protein
MGVLLISEVKLKNFTNINKNVDIDVLKSEVQVAQDIDLQTILGAKFYHHLLTQVQSTGNTFNDDETILVNEYIQPYLIQTAYFNAIPHIMYRTMNRGIVEGTMENASSVDIATMKYLRSLQKQRADWYAQRLLDYLLTGRGQNKFPDYLNASTLDGIVPDRVQKYNNGIFLANSTRKGFNGKQMTNLNGGAGSTNGSGFNQGYSEWANAWANCPDCF